MTQIKEKSFINTYGSDSLDSLIERLQSTSDPKRRYEYILWLAKSLPILTEDLHLESTKVKGCISEVYVFGILINGKIQWKGYSDALITKGLLAFLVKGLNDLTPFEVLSIDEKFIEMTGLSKTLTPSRSNGFLNIFLKMKAQAKNLSLTGSSKDK
ncbi:SufE family protein [Prochlorococcus marinus]|uniref:Cysteine desulfuration protein SufE n=1 Tax=Prochlorococcus marinus XMU1408 TaxID=2213228 RepID=A0A318R3V7_PROMR|nr:SufE family protein [Prochlorococcus marinus]MBW3042308.1 cysteine desulfuration protein SufE [Prochlorococcus marinus str. XMU1408]PYE01694.1 cysteine desulfuration protein SufE [Prochlorococcus marinus XMU1408]